MSGYFARFRLSPKGFSAVPIRLLPLGFALLFTGCETAEQYSLTYWLWDNGDLSKYNEPHPEPAPGVT